MPMTIEKIITTGLFAARASPEEFFRQQRSLAKAGGALKPPRTLEESERRRRALIDEGLRATVLLAMPDPGPCPCCGEELVGVLGPDGMPRGATCLACYNDYI